MSTNNPYYDDLGDAADILMAYLETNHGHLTTRERRELCLEIGKLCSPDGVKPDPHKLAAEYEMLKERMLHYPSEGEIMRLALQNMELAVL